MDTKNSAQDGSISSLSTRMSSAESAASTLTARVGANEVLENRRAANADTELNLVDSSDFFGDMSTWVLPVSAFVNVAWHDGRAIRAQQSKEDNTGGCVC
jgi:hypothetical protein